jgi:hypothetical protein
MDTRSADGRTDVTPYRYEGRRSTAAPVIGLGGVVLVVGTFLSWASHSAPAVAHKVDESISGSSLPDGRMAMGLGFAMVMIAVVMLATRRVGAWFDADLLGLALATAALVLTIATWASIGKDSGVTASRDADIGLYVAVVGSAIAFIGSLVGLMKSGSDRATAGSSTTVGTSRV